MNIKILASTNETKQDIKTNFNLMAGNFAGICYMSNDIEKLIAQPDSKKLSRAELVKTNGHHSCFDHEYITLYLEDVPKLFAMLLNNERAYNSSEKSARYTKMKMSDLEEELYNKWKDIFEKLITQKYGNEKYFDEKRVSKLAQENARYFLSVYTPTSLAYTASYRQLNYIYKWLTNIENSPSELLKKLAPSAKQFCDYLKSNNLVDEKIADFASDKGFSLLAKKNRNEYFGDVYSTRYFGSLAQFAQAQRHRTLCYELEELKFKTFYIPRLIKQNAELKKMWIEDMVKVKDNIPQGLIVKINERGNVEDFIRKTKERLCTSAQLEIEEQTMRTLERYIASTEDEDIKNELSKYSTGARCTSGYKCNSPCGFKDGITLEREI